MIQVRAQDHQSKRQRSHLHEVPSDHSLVLVVAILVVALHKAETCFKGSDFVMQLNSNSNFSHLPYQCQRAGQYTARGRFCSKNVDSSGTFLWHRSARARCKRTCQSDCWIQAHPAFTEHGIIRAVKANTRTDDSINIHSNTRLRGPPWGRLAIPRKGSKDVLRNACWFE